MKLIKSSLEILDQEPGLQGIYKQIELAGRTCYKSLDKITEDSAEGFVDRMIKSQHYAMLEHGTVYLQFKGSPNNNPLHKYLSNPYSKVNIIQDAFSVNQGDPDLYDKVKAYERKRKWAGDTYYVTTNYRVLVENDWLEDLEYLCEPTEYHERRVTVRFTTDRGVSHEFVRHRVFSFAQESTRYCNYSKDKFNNELTFIIPSWLAIEEGSYGIGHSFGNGHFYECNENRIYCDETNKEEFFKVLNFLKTLNLSSQVYMSMLNTFGLTPQQARQVLPNALKTELVMTGFVSDWQHFFRLRTSIIAETGKPHPDASALADPLYKDFIARGYMESLV